MPVPSRDGVNRTLQNEYRSYIDATSDLRNWSRDWSPQIRATGVSFTRAAAWSDYLKGRRAVVESAVSASGLSGYAADQINQPGLDLATEHAAFIAALDACIAWLVANLPTGVSYVDSIDADGTVNYAFSTVGQAVPLANLMDVLNATIDPQQI